MDGRRQSGGRLAYSGGGPHHLLDPQANANGAGWGEFGPGNDEWPATAERAAVDFATEPAERIFRMIQQAPDVPALDTGGTPPPPQEPQDGDHRPERDWPLIGILAFTVGFGAMTAVRAGLQLIRELA